MLRFKVIIPGKEILCDKVSLKCVSNNEFSPLSTGCIVYYPLSVCNIKIESFDTELSFNFDYE